MLGLKKKGPSRPTEAFAHADGCKIVRADPGFEPEWQEIEEGTGGGPASATAKTSTSHASTRARLDPLDPATFRHAPQCEHRDTTDPAIVRAILRVQDRGGLLVGANAAPANTAGRSRTTPRRRVG